MDNYIKLTLLIVDSLGQYLKTTTSATAIQLVHTIKENLDSKNISADEYQYNMYALLSSNVYDISDNSLPKQFVFDEPIQITFVTGKDKGKVVNLMGRLYDYKVYTQSGVVYDISENEFLIK